MWKKKQIQFWPDLNQIQDLKKEKNDNLNRWFHEETLTSWNMSNTQKVLYSGRGQRLFVGM